MRTYALLAVLGIGWAVLAAPTCTNNATTSGAGGSGGGAGQHANMDASTPSTGGASGAGTGGVMSTGSGGSGCALAIHLGSTACNACASTSCCNEATGCDMPDQGGGDAAGNSGCAKLASCVSGCLVGNPDAGQPAGTVPDCFDSCNPSHVYNVTQITNAQILIACLSNGCASACR
jgi:hypothetical protein